MIVCPRCPKEVENGSELVSHFQQEHSPSLFFRCKADGCLFWTADLDQVMRHGKETQHGMESNQKEIAQALAKVPNANQVR